VCVGLVNGIIISLLRTQAGVVDEPCLDAETALSDVMATDWTLTGEEVSCCNRQLGDRRMALRPRSHTVHHIINNRPIPNVCLQGDPWWASAPSQRSGSLPQLKFSVSVFTGRYDENLVTICCFDVKDYIFKHYNRQISR